MLLVNQEPMASSPAITKNTLSIVRIPITVNMKVKINNNINVIYGKSSPPF